MALTMDWQQGIALAIVGITAAAMAWRVRRRWRGWGGGTGCGGCWSGRKGCGGSGDHASGGRRQPIENRGAH
ncbi:MAG TPA: hypothetical protein PKM73_00475 [Verrucomicrobiota bacterium]|nr:hypothetical protein [Verrucomicrobiota bacterium]HNU49517.1 hypothetical protein [Verrucomicrobiota bacterium]